MSAWDIEGSLIYTYFIGYALVTVLGARFTWYARRNRGENQVKSQDVIWMYVVFIGATGTLFGAIGLVGVLFGEEVAFRHGVLLGMVLLLALGMREVFFNDALSNSERQRGGSSSLRRYVEVSFVVVTLTALIGGGFLEDGDRLVLVEGVSALLFVTYGLFFGWRYLSNPLHSGTGMDTLLRHLLPVLLFGGLVLVVDLGLLFGVDRVIVAQVQLVLLVITASSLMAATIKLRQNLASI